MARSLSTRERRSSKLRRAARALRSFGGLSRGLTIAVGNATIGLGSVRKGGVVISVEKTANKRNTGATALAKVRKALVASGLQVSV